MFRTTALALAIFMLFPLAFSQQQDELAELLNKALVIDANIKVLAKDPKVSWSMQAVRLTIPGKPINLQLKGKNISLDITLTPYQTNDSQKILLVVQNQIVLQETDSRAAEFFSNLKQIIIQLGDKIQFYPLGMAETSAFNIVLELQIIPYNEAKIKKIPLPNPESLQESSKPQGR